MTVNVRRKNTKYSSPGMEKYGMKIALEKLAEKNVDVYAVCIDRSAANIKMMRTFFPDIRTQHDPWHLIKKVTFLPFFISN